MQTQMLAILFNGGAFEPFGLACLDPQFAGLANGNAGAIGDVRPLAHGDASFFLPCVGLPLELERLEPPAFELDKMAFPF